MKLTCGKIVAFNFHILSNLRVQTILKQFMVTRGFEQLMEATI